ncbi:hypothetical protein ACFRFQ_03995 [Rhodococcus sp. NPDC056743]|uniref:hypothetical protein n=1 Tax=Rhodococcus sp. NPDC056743 TaxID=3345934 RepID=UPI00366F8515
MIALAPSDTEQSPRHRFSGSSRSILVSWTVIGVSVALGTLLIGMSYRMSSEGTPPNVYYATFWVGMLLGLVPLAAKLATAGTTVNQRIGAITLLGLFTAVPKYLRNPFGPSYHDEYAHWRESVDVMTGGQLFPPNSIIPIVEYFPGTSALSASLSQLTGLSAWSAGEVLMVIAHVMTILGAYVLGTSLLRSARAGAVAALIYALNPSAIYFDTQFAYEGVAITFLMWALALTSLAARSDDRRRRISYLSIAVTCGAVCVVTHHLTTIALLLISAAIAVTVTAFGFVRAHQRPYVWWILLGGTGTVGAAWLVFVASPTVGYLSPYLANSLTQLSSIATSQSSGRELLAANVQPLWERAFTAAAPATVAAIFALALLVIARVRSKVTSATLAFVAIGAVYFPSVLFVLAPSGAEGARRSWAFSYVGVAVTCALVVAFQDRLPRMVIRFRTPISLSVLMVVLIGNVGAGLNDPYRFPGPFLWGSDTRSASAEARTVAEHIRLREGRVRVVTDRYTTLALAAYGELYVSEPSSDFPVWELTQTDSDPDAKLASDLAGATYGYLVVDTRMADAPPFNGDNYGSDDPLAGLPTPASYLDRLDHVPWASLIMSTEHLRVYRLDTASVGTELITPTGTP